MKSARIEAKNYQQNYLPTVWSDAHRRRMTMIVDRLEPEWFESAFLAVRSLPTAVEVESGPPPVTGKPNRGFAPFDELMQSVLEEFGVPGAALAVARNGNLVYARGYGYADLKAKQPVMPTSLFRIASISKPITAAAVLKLVERRKLSLDDKVSQLLDLGKPGGEHSPADAPADAWREVTIRHLLQHTGGWDREKSFDPMFRSVEFAREAGMEPPADASAVIRAMLRRELDFHPGERAAYSNFGYCLLGRVVEKAAGEPYAQAVYKLVLTPMGIQRMKLARTHVEDRAPGEVRYYVLGAERTGKSVFSGDLDAAVPLPYGAWCIETMDAHGGWLASAVDLVRFGTQLESKLLSTKSVQAMTELPPGAAGYESNGAPKDVYYGLGWCVRRVDAEGHVNIWHTGALDGTSALLVRRHDGLCWAVLFNARDDRLLDRVDRGLHVAADSVKNWTGSMSWPLSAAAGVEPK